MVTLAQSPKTVLVEHFTNTKCSICAGRNPDIYATLDNYPQVIHIAFHPSAPYNSCYFSLQNVTENDTRTIYYNAYGSTPRLVLNGKLLASANPAITNTTIDTALNQTSPVEVSATEQIVSADSVKVRVVVRTTGNLTDGQLLLFAGAVQDTVQYSAGNGEQLHHDVFRKALTFASGDLFNTPALNDSIEFTFGYRIKSGWNAAAMNTICWVQAGSKQVLNAAKSQRVEVPSAIGNVANEVFTVYPNPVKSELHINVPVTQQGVVTEVYNTLGSKIYTGTAAVINTADWAHGFYFVRVGSIVKRVVKE
jgi:hypothetical protein